MKTLPDDPEAARWAYAESRVLVHDLRDALNAAATHGELADRFADDPDEVRLAAAGIRAAAEQARGGRE